MQQEDGLHPAFQIKIQQWTQKHIDSFECTAHTFPRNDSILHYGSNLFDKIAHFLFPFSGLVMVWGWSRQMAMSWQAQPDISLMFSLMTSCSQNEEPGWMSWKLDRGRWILSGPLCRLITAMLPSCSMFIQTVVLYWWKTNAEIPKEQSSRLFCQAAIVL